MRRTILMLATVVLAGAVAATPAQGQDDPATCLRLGDFELHVATIVGTAGDDTLRGTDGPDATGSTLGADGGSRGGSAALVAGK